MGAPMTNAVRTLAVGLLSAALVTGCTTMVTGTPTASHPGTSEQGLAALVPTPDEVAEILQTPPLVVDRTYEAMTDWDISVDNPRCMSAVANTVSETYEGADYVDVFGMVLNEADADDPSYDIDPAAVQFSSPTAAQSYVDRIASDWRACADTSVSYTQNGETRQWQVHSPEEQDGVWATVSYEQPNEWACSRAIGAMADIVADVRSCGFGMDEGSAEIAQDILSRVATV